MFVLISVCVRNDKLGIGSEGHHDIYIMMLMTSILTFQHAHALELLSAHLKKGNRAMDVGSGSGYLTACMAHMVRLLWGY